MHKKIQDYSIRTFEHLLEELKLEKNNIFLPDFKFDTPLHLLLEKNKFDILYELYNYMKDDQNSLEVQNWQLNQEIDKTFNYIKNDFLFDPKRINYYKGLARCCNYEALKKFVDLKLIENFSCKSFYGIVCFFEAKLQNILNRNK